MHPCVRRGIVDVYPSVFVGNPSVGKRHVHHVADVFFALRYEEISSGLCDDACGIVKGGHIEIQHITQSGGTAAYTVCQVEPALRRADGVRTFAVLHFHDGVVVAGIDDAFLADLGMRDVVDQCPSDASAGTGIDESVLRTGVEGVLSVDEFGVEHHVALL